MQPEQSLLSEYEHQAHYDQVVKQVVAGPRPFIRRHDLCCLGVLGALLGVFLGIGIYEMVEFSKVGTFFPQASVQGGVGASGGSLSVGQHIGIIFAGIVMGLLLSYMYVILLRYLPKCMVYTMIILTLALITIILVLCIISEIVALIVIIASLLAIYVLLLFCYRQQIEIGIQLVIASSYFLTANLRILLAPIYNAILSILLSLFYIFAMGSMLQLKQYNQQLYGNSTKQDIFISMYSILISLFMVLLYYMMTAVVSHVCAGWYYQLGHQHRTIWGAYRSMGKQLGSLVFAAMVVTVVKVLMMFVSYKQSRSKSCLACCCLCLVQCCLKKIKNMLFAMNNYTVITLTITKQSYFQCAKTTAGLCWQHLALVQISTLITNFLASFGYLFTVCLPIAITAAIMSTLTNNLDQQLFVAGVVGICCVLISKSVFVVVSEGVSCTLVYWMLDEGLYQAGLGERRMPKEVAQEIRAGGVQVQGVQGEEMK